MNINKLEVGAIYKNYKALCEVLNEPVRSGKSKKLQVEDWERFFSYSKSGHSFIITEIFDNPTEKIDLRSQGNRRVKYIDKIERLILDLLAQEENKGQIFLSKNKLLRELKMVSGNYSLGKIKPFKLSKMLNIDIKEISDFYESSDGMLKRNLIAALNSLQDQSLIFWRDALTVCQLEIEEGDKYSLKAIKSETKDEYGDEMVKFGVEHPKQKLNYRKATLDEIKLITSVQRDILKKYDCDKISEIFKRNKQNEFYKEVRDILFDKANIFFYYNSFEIFSNKEHIIEEWKLQEKEIVQQELNDSVFTRIQDNTEKRHEDAPRKYEESKKDKYNMRMSKGYVLNGSTLNYMLIKHDVYSMDL